MKRLIIALLFSLFVFGCAQNKLRLVKDVTPEQLNKDNAECRLEAQKATQFDLSNNMFIQAENFNTANANCLQAKGYTYQSEPSKETLAVSERYKQAFEKAKEKVKGDEDVVINCRSKEDKEYLDCLNEVNRKQVETDVFPDMERTLLNERKEYENLLLRKEITRLQFKEAVSKLADKYNLQRQERTQSDINKGRYTGNPMY